MVISKGLETNTILGVSAVYIIINFHFIGFNGLFVHLFAQVYASNAQ